jgi:acetoin utilization protein AcuC
VVASAAMSAAVGIYQGAGIRAYGYEEKPWFLPGRLDLFLGELAARGLDRRARMIEGPKATDEEILIFHTRAHLERVRRLCAANEGALDHGPTLARAGIEAAATHVVGAVLDAARRIVTGELTRAFVPIAGFHHAHREEARAYCLYNDPVILIRWLLQQRIVPIGYVDVDVHHGDGVYAAFAADPSVYIADVHEDGRTLFPHSPEAPGPGPFPGDRENDGEGEARGTKLNLPLAAGATDADFDRAWEEAEAFLERAKPAFIVFESGADGLAGDPMAHLGLTPESLRKATRRLRAMAERHASGRLLVLGGGGYAEGGMVSGWCAVVEALLEG